MSCDRDQISHEHSSPYFRFATLWITRREFLRAQRSVLSGVDHG